MTGLISALRQKLQGPETLRPGDVAPRFALLDEHGRLQRLEQFRGRWVVLYFYPKDNTPGCSREACDFRDQMADLRREGAEVLGVSLDSPASHHAFAVRYALNFRLLSDPDGALAQAYGTLFTLGPLRVVRRRTFLIDPEGRIARIYREVDVTVHSGQVLADLRALRSRPATA